MEPNETLVHSRLKEYFGLKVSMKDWKKFILTLYEETIFLEKVNKHSSFLSKIGVSLMENGNMLLDP